MEAVKIFAVSLPASLYDKLETFCKNENFSKAHIVRTAVEKELRRRQ